MLVCAYVYVYVCIQAKAEIIAKSYQTILETIGENVERKGLLKTPMRAAKAMLTFSKGYAMDVKEVVNDALFEEESPDMVIVRNMDITSMCEHHLVIVIYIIPITLLSLHILIYFHLISALLRIKLLDFCSLHVCDPNDYIQVPFVGKISIAYLPSGRVLGLSKFSRVAEIFARRLQVQERLGREIADALEEVLQPRGLAVHIVSSHMCMVLTISFLSLSLVCQGSYCLSSVIYPEMY